MAFRLTWRLLRLFVTTLLYTLFLSVRVAHLPTAQRAAFRARRQMIGCQALARILNVRVRTQGPLPEGGAVLVVANHLGMLDALILASQMPIAFVGKAEINDWPFAGWVCRAHGVIFVERDRRSSTKTFIAQVQRVLHTGVRVLVFPEGTTNGHVDLLPFKTGAFESVAHMEDGAVLPLYMHVAAVDGVPTPQASRQVVLWDGQPARDHARDLLTQRSLDLDVIVGTPYPTSGRDRKHLASTLYERVSALRPSSLVPAPDQAETAAPS
ncbi:MAG: lysophospholipid acyltransferase family protein [Bacteroidota bacterium]